MDMFVVYDSPRDAPGRAVVRRWVIGPGTHEPTPQAREFDGLDEAVGEMLALGLARIDRMPGDDPCIHSVWV
jgi:hypothetical protein